MDFVKQSANMALLFTHLKRQFSWSLSRIRRHSKVVLLSEQAGVEVLVERSYTDFQSVATTDRGASRRMSLGFDQSTAGFFIHSQNTLIQLSLSSVDPKAIASALKVLRTTLGIFFEDHATGHTTVLTLSSSFPSVEKMSVPCLVDLPLPVSKEASEKAQKVTACSGMGTIIKLTGFALASYKTRFALIVPPFQKPLLTEVHRPLPKGQAWCALQRIGGFRKFGEAAGSPVV